MSALGSADDAVVHQLQSKEHAELLDAIDRLRRESINSGLNLSIPEIVVCGDQSSGKSSVLEAIAGVPFPLGVGTVTCFATEVVLRNAADHSIKVALFPASTGWLEEQRQRIQVWQPDRPVSDVSDVPAVVKEAAQFLKSMDSSRKFWRDRLQIELSGPSQPHLTLVDLPGLIHNDTETTNKDMILRLTKERLASQRAVILAVLDAPTDLERHHVIQLLKETDSQQRTMGILTMPDKLVEASDQEALRMRMVENGTKELGLGWHVLRNLPHERLERSANARDREESQFFQKRAWSQLDESLLGVDQLRSKLSRELLVRIQQDLPKLIEEMELLRSRNEDRLQRLGDARETDMEKRKYLMDMLMQLHALVQEELYGSSILSGEFSSLDASKQNLLREVINNDLDNFARSMLVNGHTFSIEDDRWTTTLSPLLPESVPILFRNDPRCDNVQCYTVSPQRYCSALVQHMNRTRGTNLRGTNSTALTMDIFRQQSRAWKSIALQYTENCEAAVREFFTRACDQVAGSYAADRLLSYLIRPALLDKFTATEEKVQELLWPYTHCHPMIIDARFNASKRSNPWAAPSRSWMEEVVGSDWATSEHEIAAKAMDIADTYYEVAMRTFVENVATLAIERCLLHDLPDIVSPRNMERLDMKDIAAIASEQPADRHKRATYQTQLAVLAEALQICRMHNKRSTQARRPVINASDQYTWHSNAPLRAMLAGLMNDHTRTEAGACGFDTPNSQSSKASSYSFVQPKGEPVFPFDTSKITSGHTESSLFNTSRQTLKPDNTDPPSKSRQVSVRLPPTEPEHNQSATPVTSPPSGVVGRASQNNSPTSGLFQSSSGFPPGFPSSQPFPKAWVSSSSNSVQTKPATSPGGLFGSSPANGGSIVFSGASKPSGGATSPLFGTKPAQ